MNKYEKWICRLCDELCEEMERFEKTPTKEHLCCAKEIAEFINELQEMEMYGTIKEFAEDKFKKEDEDEYYPMHHDYWKMFNARRQRDSKGRYARGNMGMYNNYPITTPYVPYNTGDWHMAYTYPMYDEEMPMGRRDGHKGDIMNNWYREGQPYMLRQENGKPIITPYAKHDKMMIPKKLTDEQIEHWMKEIVNEDGSTGAKWTKQQVEELAKKAGIDYKEYGIEALYAATNMVYSDYCAVAHDAGVNNAEFYVKLADAFLNDEDFDGDGREKLSIYYHEVVEH